MRLFSKKDSWNDKISNSLKNTYKEATINGFEYPIVNIGYDGEKIQNELGYPKQYEIYYDSTCARGWQLYLESDICMGIVNTFVNDVIGKGLKLETQANEDILGVYYNQEEYKKIENRFRLYTNDNCCSYNNNYNYHEFAKLAYTSALVGGDCLIIYRLQPNINVELIDGRLIVNPNIDEFEKAEKRGNRIIRGIEISQSGEHIAYHINTTKNNGIFETTRITKYTTRGRLQAKMLYGSIYRSDDVRGLPLLIRSIEKLKKLDRYIEAMVSSAEERAKYAIFFEHNHFSNGENPVMSSIKAAQTAGIYGENTPNYASELEKAGRKVLLRTGKETVSLPIGVSAKSLESTTELRLKEFSDAVTLYVTASIGMPIEVYLKKFEQSFSASRMASQIWQDTIDIERCGVEHNIYQPFYNLFLDSETMNKKITLKGYDESLKTNDIIMLQAYRNARFIGSRVPQADPVKEVKSIILMLQNKLITHEQACEMLGVTDFDGTIKKLGIEYENIQSIIPFEYQTPTNAETTKAELPAENM